MRPLSFVLAIAFLIAGPLLGHAPEAGLPGVGTLTYTGTPLAIDTPQRVAAVMPR